MQGDIIREQLRAHIVSNFLFDSDEVADDVSLMEEGILDSTGVLEMVLFMEETYGITVEDDDVRPENLDSINALTAFVTSKQAGLPAALAS